MTFLKQVINLWRIRHSNDPADKWVLTRLKVDPDQRDSVRAFHDGRVATIITGTEGRR
tara:strand:+ start:299 stop:472 length:174 start_codon:yes stop_codon:yes gene_type:complete